MAIRTFKDCILDEKHAFNAHPEDYTLMEIGEYDDQAGAISPLEPIQSLGNGLEYQKSTPTLKEASS